MRVAPLLLALALLAACAEPAPAPVVERVAKWKGLADKAFADGDWTTAGEAYQHLFALLDPVADRADIRAAVAFRIARCQVALARHASDESRMFMWSRYARLWLREALALHPKLHQVWFERAQLIELRPADDERDAKLLRAYRTYLAGVSATAKPPGAEEAKNVQFAQVRVKELAP